MMIELGLLCVIVVAFLVDRDRRDKRHHEQLLAHRLETAGLTERLTTQAEAHRREVAHLCQRIQAPEVAVMEHNQTMLAPPTVQHPMTDEAAAAAERAQMIAEMERIENEALR